MKHAISHIHFVGIGGAGMSGIAEVLANMGFTVSGSDLSDSATLQRLASLGIRTFVGHNASHVAGTEAVVTSSAVHGDNPEVVQARSMAIPVVPRAQMLAELMRMKQGIAIAGTHGKTTTTSLVASVLAQGGLDPTFVIGGLLNSAGVNARLGTGEYIVVEADESDASFLNLLPVMAVVTNIDADHMETYGHDLGRLHTAFVDFLHRMPFYGTAVVCTDDAGVRDIVGRITCRVRSYGVNDAAHFRAVNVRAVGAQMHFTVQRKFPAGATDLNVVLNLAGHHNVLNALSAIAIAAELQIDDAALLKALADFSGVGRRFQRYDDATLPTGGTVTVIDDYGHHPVEMAVTLAAARGAFPGRRLVLAFQPHRYTRTRDCFDAFVQVMGQADVVVLTDVYAAGEAAIAGADSAALAGAMRAAGLPVPVLVGAVTDMPMALQDNCRDGDVLLCMGAGSIGTVPGKLLELLQKNERATHAERAL
ncbi:MAG: UDP-N-acetylmuramate--L-alanine ligase [Rhodoferax sp.]|nr:UDP-N-acetylmuramate--L-alanine ligase [Rhodoferax sp.]